MPMLTANKDAATGDGFDFGFGSSDEPYSIPPGLELVSDSAAGIGADYSNNYITNAGSVIGDTYGVFFESGSNSGVLVNQSTGSIQGGTGVSIQGGFADSIINYGSITGFNSGISDIAGDSTVKNFGYIYGLQSGIAAADLDTIFNAGTIVSMQNGVDLDSASGETVSLDNAGLVQGDRYAVDAEGPGALTIANRGTLDGGVDLADGGSGADKVRNTGRIDGDVDLDNGTNTFNGRGGTLDGVIFGGTGADTLMAGNDGEKLNGGLGHDTLYGGSGADVFAFTSSGQSTYDHIHGFDVGNDLIQLNHVDFGKLVAGKTPVFSTATAATSASDHLFYDSATGGLFYDADGNGSGAKSAIAILSSGLHLTAADFKVV